MQEKLRIITAQKALKSLMELPYQGGATTIERDAIIQRFEYTFEATWKALKSVLAFEGRVTSSPREVIRTAVSFEILEPKQGHNSLKMLEARNKTSHTYNEEVAINIYNSMPVYVETLKIILKKCEQRINEQ